MSYKCDICRKTVGNGIPSFTLVTATRPKKYVQIQEDQLGFVRERTYTGFETVKEKRVCVSCYEKEKEKNDKHI